MGIEYAKSLGIKKLMLGCFSDNLPSIKTILKCGGKLKETKIFSGSQFFKIPEKQEKLVNIYWIDL